MLLYGVYASGAKGHKFESCTARHEFQALAVLPRGLNFLGTCCRAHAGYPGELPPLSVFANPSHIGNA